MPRYLLLLLLLFALGACGRSTPTQYYLFQTSSQGVKTDALPAKNLRVGQVNVPGYLDRSGIVSRMPDSAEIVVAEFHVWAEPVADGIRRTVQEALAPLLLPVGINTPAPGDDSDSEYVLALDVQRLDGILGEQAVLEARWTLRGRHEKLLGRGIYADSEATAQNTHEELVRAQNRMLLRMGVHLGELLPTLIRSAS